MRNKAPGELVRETFLNILADPNTGLNPAFVFHCGERQIAVPMPGAGGTAGLDAQPFDFSPGSATVFRMEEQIDWLERNTAQQYPCIVAHVKSTMQFREGRPYGAIFAGEVVVEANLYLAWMQSQTPEGNDFETHLDALEISLLNCLNASTANWGIIPFSNLIDIPRRFPLTVCNNNQLLRRGLNLRISTTVVL